MPSYRSSKRLTAEEFVADLRHMTRSPRLEIIGPPGKFLCETEAIDANGVFVIKQNLEAGLELGVDPERNAYVFLHNLSGTANVEFPDGDVTMRPGQGHVFSNLEPYVLRVSPNGCRMLTSVSAELVKNVFTEHFGTVPKTAWEFAPSFDGKSGPGETLSHIASALLSSDNTNRAAERSQKRLVDALVLHVIEGFTHNHSQFLDVPPPSLLPRQVKMAQDLMEEFALENMSIIDIAERIGVSARALQYSFTRHCGMTPVSYYRLVRLRRAVAELSSVGEMPMRDVAEKWGFSNLGRFSALCQKEFGKRPHEFRAGAN